LLPKEIGGSHQDGGFMAIFISYSHNDSEFVEKLSWQLVAAKTNVWIDKWEINVGDSLIRKIEEAIQKADALVAVLSKASTQSEWCRKELTAGLVRELEERQVLVLPVLLEECEIPLFLRDKKYADFRKGFDQGLREILEALARGSNPGLGRVDEVGGFIDWSITWGTDEQNAVSLHVMAAEHAKEQPYTTLSYIKIELNDVGSRRHLELAEAGFDDFAEQLVLTSIATVPEIVDFSVRLRDQHPKTQKFTVRDSKAGLEYRITAVCNRLGQDTGRDILLHIGRQLQQMASQGMRVMRPAPQERKEEFLAIMRKYRSDWPF
jgi:hypothetical protein